MLIRDAKESDCLNLTALSIQVWLHTYATSGIRDEISKFVLDEFIPEYFRKIIESETKKLLVSVLDDHLVGYICVDFDSICKIDEFEGYEIETLYIQEHFQGRGIGSQLINRTRESYGAKVWLSTWIHNNSAIGFYRHFGFKQVGTTYFDLQGEKHENLVLAISDL